MCYTLDNVEEVKQDEPEASEQMTKQWDRISRIIYKGLEENTKDRVAIVLSAREDREAQKSGWIDQEIGHSTQVLPKQKELQRVVVSNQGEWGFKYRGKNLTNLGRAEWYTCLHNFTKAKVS